MTTDPFTTAAQKSAERAHPGHRSALPGDSVLDLVDTHVAGWEAARDHLAAQQPTDAEVDAAAVVIWESYDLLDRAAIRDALSAARAARRDEEQR